MPHSITVNLPTRPQGEPIVTEWGVVANGETLVVSDEQLAVWRVQNPDREVPTSIGPTKDDSLEKLREDNPERADAIEADLDRLRSLDLSDTGSVVTTRAPTQTYSTMKAPTPEKEGEQ